MLTQPHSVPAEQSLLGGLMLDNTAWLRIADKVNQQDFYRKEHQLIFQAVTVLTESGQPIDIVTLAELLERRGDLDGAGGLSYLISIARETPTAANILAYAKIVRDTAMLRRMVTVGTEIIDSANQSEGRPVAEILDEAEGKIFEIADQVSRNRGGFQPLQDLLAKAVNLIEIRSERKDSITGLATGFTDFDALTSGLQPADLVIVAARPSMGKTAYAMGIAAHVAVTVRRPVAVFSLEMPSDALAMRLIASTGRINQQQMRSGRLEDDDWSRMTLALQLLQDAPLFIDDSPAISPMDVRARARRLKREQKDLGLIVIDYLQLMQSHRNGENRTSEISAISRSLKSLAKELNVPVMALSQLNRSLEQRTNKRPIMSDLRESGAIEQDADLIAFIYRDEVYNTESQDKGIAEIIISKQRNGPIGTTRLTFFSQYTRFENYAEPA